MELLREQKRREQKALRGRGKKPDDKTEDKDKETEPDFTDVNGAVPTFVEADDDDGILHSFSVRYYFDFFLLF